VYPVRCFERKFRLTPEASFPNTRAAADWIAVIARGRSVRANIEPMWPSKTPARAFVERRRRLQSRLSGPALLVSGFSRPRNFAGNRYPFRAESHFLYFVGCALEGAALLIEPNSAVLYAVPPDPEEELWTGPAPTFDEIGEAAGLEVRPIEDLEVPPETLSVPAQDWEGALFQSELLDRDIDPGTGAELDGPSVALADALIELRLQHDEAAVHQLREAAWATAEAHRAGLSVTRAGMREAAVRAAMEAAFAGWGYAASYNPIVTRHGEVLHATRSDGVLAAGDLLLADVGAETPEGWAGDVTRTWPVSAKFSPTQRAVYDVVLESQRAALALVKPGVRYREVHRAAARAMVNGLVELGIYKGDPAELFELGAAALFFPHGVGHLLGLDVHDMEDLGDRAGYAPGRERSQAPGDRYLRLDRDLLPGMALTIEPGFYQIAHLLDRPEEVGELEPFLQRDVLARFRDVRGIRIEDDVLVTDSGFEILTEAIPKSAEAIEVARAG
jgi:Xaa-Pro aminopeptidase